MKHGQFDIKVLYPFSGTLHASSALDHRLKLRAYRKALFTHTFVVNETGNWTENAMSIIWGTHIMRLMHTSSRAPRASGTSLTAYIGLLTCEDCKVSNGRHFVVTKLVDHSIALLLSEGLEDSKGSWFRGKSATIQRYK